MALLDQIDIKILQALQNNAKVNMKELSAELNISKTPVYERVKRLEEEGYIRNYVALVDNKKVGLPLVVFCNVSLAVHSHFNLISPAESEAANRLSLRY